MTVVFRGEALTTPLCCEPQREMISEITGGFNAMFTVPLDLTGSKYHFGRCLLPRSLIGLRIPPMNKCRSCQAHQMLLDVLYVCGNVLCMISLSYVFTGST